MSKPVDVFITEAELEEGRRVKKTTCLKVDRTEMRPVHCVSKPGISSGMLFAAPEPRQVGRYLSDSEMAIMYDKFVGPSSLNNAAVRHEQTERDRMSRISPSNSGVAASASESRVPSIDSGDRTAPAPSAHMAVVLAAAGCQFDPDRLRLVDPEAAAEKAAASATMKYVAPKIAKKYGIQQSYTPAGVKAAAAAAASRGNTAYRSGVSRGLETNRLLAGGLSFASSGGDVGSGKPPRPPSAAFGAVSREKAQRTGSHFVYGGNAGVPAPGKYTPRYGATEKAKPALLWGKPPSTSGEAAAAAAGADGGVEGSAEGGGGGAAAAARPGSAPAGARRSRPSSAPAAGYSPAAAAAAAATAPQAQPPHRAARSGLQRSASSGDRHHHGGGGGGLTAEARAQLQNRHEELFAAAHRVHPRKESIPGSMPFKAVERKSIFDTPPGSQLLGNYFHEGYDDLTRRSSRPSSAFRTQTQRQWANGAKGETGPCVGPGSYGKEVPGTNTGRHVPAGHPSLSKTPDFSRTAPRPCSAPPVRPPPATAFQQGYWGPDGPATSLFPDEPDYNELVAVRFLQERTSMREPAGAGLPPRRPPSHQLSSNSQHGAPQQPSRSTSLQSRHAASALGPFGGADAAAAAAAGGGSNPTSPTGAAAAAAAAAHQQAPGTGGANSKADNTAGKVVDERPVSYVTADRLGALSSAGLAKRVPGGAFSNVTREGSCHAMRVMGVNTVTPPTSAGVAPVAQDLAYEYDYSVEGHRGRTPAWNLPPNRNALSQQWMAAAASAYLS